MLILNPSRYKREGTNERCLLHATESICNIFLLLKRLIFVHIFQVLFFSIKDMISKCS